MLIAKTLFRQSKMEIIKEPVKNIASIWRPQKISQTLCRPMKYVLYDEVEEGLLLYNLVTAEMILLNKEEQAVYESLPAAYCPGMDELIAHHFIVKENYQENKSVKELRALLLKLDKTKRVNGFTILPTTECNARCYYCFESDHKRCTLTNEKCADVVAYIADKCKMQPIEISWFGGEPLVGRKQIEQICTDLRNKGIKFKSSITSNAYLFDDALIKEAKEDWNVQTVQITLDGTEEVYNKTKAYINPKDNPFKRVLRNIEMLLDQGLAVNVRLNVTDKNADDLSKLIDLLSERFEGKSGFTCYSHAVYEGVGFDPLEYDDLIRQKVDIMVAELDTKLMRIGLLGSYSRLPQLRYMSDNDSCRVIYPDGQIGKCENLSSSDSIGDIYKDITDKEQEMRYKKTRYMIECEDCCLYPNCVNLEICPDTGKCTDVRVAWKLNRYRALMRNRYAEYKDRKSQTDDEVIVKCEP